MTKDNQEERRRRSLTDEDIKTLAQEIRKQMVSQFYSDLGSGVWALAWKAIVIGAMAIAAYGAVKETHL